MKESILRVSVKGFKPVTANEDPLNRKRKLRDEIQQSGQISEDAKKRCRESDRLAINVRFFLFGKSGVRGRHEKDLDNLLKIFCDVLPDFIDNSSPPTDKGLGLIASDNAIFELNCSKTLVDEEKDEGIDFEIFQIAWSDT